VIESNSDERIRSGNRRIRKSPRQLSSPLSISPPAAIVARLADAHRFFPADRVHENVIIRVNIRPDPSGRPASRYYRRCIHSKGSSPAEFLGGRSDLPVLWLRLRPRRRLRICRRNKRPSHPRYAEGPWSDPEHVTLTVHRDEVSPFTAAPDDPKTPATTTSFFTCPSDASDLFENGATYKSFDDFFSDKDVKDTPTTYTRNPLSNLD